MGKVTGFKEYARVEEGHEAVETRVKHFKEFTLHLTDEENAELAASIKVLKEHFARALTL